MAAMDCSEADRACELSRSSVLAQLSDHSTFHFSDLIEIVRRQPELHRDLGDLLHVFAYGSISDYIGV